MSKERMITIIKEYLYTRDDILDMNEVDNLAIEIVKRLWLL